MTQFSLVGQPLWGRGIACYDVVLVTGRAHQIRCHFAESGIPIVNDQLYSWGGGNDDYVSFSEWEKSIDSTSKNINGPEHELLLQAYALTLQHPFNKNELISVKLPLPRSFQRILVSGATPSS